MISLGEVALEGGNIMDITEEDGFYDFSEMPKGGDYIVNPSRDIDPLNGITVADIILIQKHILGLSPLNSPYKILAADIDNSQKVNGADIIQLRKLLLGYYSDFPQNTSWRFVDEDHVFMDPTNPWISDIPETYEIFDLQTNMTINFKGYKVGDVNNTASPNDLIAEHIDTRSNETQEIILSESTLDSGVEKWIHFYKKEGDALEALQLGFSFDQSQVEIVEVSSDKFDMNETTYRLNLNELKLILTGKEHLTNSSDTPLFSLLIRAKEKVDVANVLMLDEEVLRNEAYNTNLELSDVALNIESMVEDAKFDYSMLELKQNEPNPWMSSTTITFVSPRSEIGYFNILDVNGRVLKSTEQLFNEGDNSIVLSGEDVLNSGVYYYEIIIGELRIMKKMIYIK
jgi:hypothetical protein